MLLKNMNGFLDNYEDSTIEKLVTTYFPEPKKKEDKVDIKKPAGKYNALKITVFVTLTFFLITASIVIFSFLFSVEVKVSKKEPMALTANLKSIADSYLKNEIYITRGGGINKEVVRNSFFKGDAGVFSKLTDDELVLVNSKGHGWGNYIIDLKEPMDFSKRNLNYAVKGKYGDECLVLEIVDGDNRSYRMGDELKEPLSDEWKEHVIDFDSAKNILDIKRISSIRFEFGSLTAGNSRNATIFLKDICLERK